MGKEGAGKSHKTEEEKKTEKEHEYCMYFVLVPEITTYSILTLGTVSGFPTAIGREGKLALHTMYDDANGVIRNRNKDEIQPWISAVLRECTCTVLYMYLSAEGLSCKSQT